MPKISIIIPVYNVENYLDRCINSVKNQSLDDLEIILVDDGSTDSSGEMCDNFAREDTRIKVIHKKNGGLSSARNEGLKYVSADLVGFVDSDDWITTDMYEYLYNLQQNNDADIVSCNYLLAKNYPTKLKKLKTKEFVFTRDEALNNYMKMGVFERINDYSAWKKIYKKDLFSDVKFPEGMLFEDIPTSFRLIQKCSKYVYSTKICYFYFQNSVSITRNQYSLKHNDLFKILTQIRGYAYGEDVQIQKLIDILEIKSYFSLLTKSARFGNSKEISDLYVKETLLIPFKKSYKLFMKEKFSLLFKILGTAYYLNWDLSKKIINFFK